MRANQDRLRRSTSPAHESDSCQAEQRQTRRLGGNRDDSGAGEVFVVLKSRGAGGASVRAGTLSDAAEHQSADKFVDARAQIGPILIRRTRSSAAGEFQRGGIVDGVGYA